MEKEKKVAIEKIVLNIEGEKVSLTPEQAKKLKSLLDEMFGKEVIREVIKEEHHHHDRYPYYWYWTLPTPQWVPNYVYCSSTGGASNLTNIAGGNGLTSLATNASSVLCSNSTLEIKL